MHLSTQNLKCLHASMGSIKNFKLVMERSSNKGPITSCYLIWTLIQHANYIIIINNSGNPRGHPPSLPLKWIPIMYIIIYIPEYWKFKQTYNTFLYQQMVFCLQPFGYDHCHSYMKIYYVNNGFKFHLQ